jgi:outer membrane protein W
MKTKVFLTLLFLAAVTSQVGAQGNENRFGVEFSLGASMATNKLAGATLNPGFGGEGIFHYRFMPNLGVYGGWGWNRFGADESFAGDDASFEETGYVLGLQYKRPIADTKTSWYLRAGGLYSHIETEDEDGENVLDTGHGLGWQLAGGFDFALGKNWSFTPGIKFNSLSREADYENVSRNFRHNYASVRFGILKRF